jgi:hypothetical protein
VISSDARAEPAVASMALLPAGRPVMTPSSVLDGAGEREHGERCLHRKFSLHVSL